MPSFSANPLPVPGTEEGIPTLTGAERTHRGYPNRSVPMVPGQPGTEWPLDQEGNATVLYSFSDGRYRFEYTGRQGESGTDT